MADFGYERLVVWKRGMELVESIYGLTRTFPRDEQFGLTSQLRRAAISIPANIAEGYGRGSNPSFANFVRMSQGSLFELRTELEVAARIGIAKREDVDALLIFSIELSRMLDGLIKKLTVAE